MFNQLYLAGGFFGALLLAIVLLIRTGRKQRQAESEKAAAQEYTEQVIQHHEAVVEQTQEILEDVEKVNETEDRLKSDPAYSGWVRDRFTRD